MGGHGMGRDGDLLAHRQTVVDVEKSGVIYGADADRDAASR